MVTVLEHVPRFRYREVKRRRDVMINAVAKTNVKVAEILLEQSKMPAIEIIILLENIFESEPNFADGLAQALWERRERNKWGATQ
jgi:hypothetical protein